MVALTIGDLTLSKHEMARPRPDGDPDESAEELEEDDPPDM